MKVRDYVNDMVVGQKWSVEVNYHDKEVDTFEYTIPHTSCKWLDNEVRYFRAFGDGITLCIDDDK